MEPVEQHHGQNVTEPKIYKPVEQKMKKEAFHFKDHSDIYKNPSRFEEYINQ